MIVTESSARLGRALLVIGLVNFGAFWIVGVCIGGDAVNGYVEGGRYFLASHGRFTEVTRSVFLYSKVHCYSVWVTHLLAAAGWWVSHAWDKRNPRSDPG